VPKPFYHAVRRKNRSRLGQAGLILAAATTNLVIGKNAHAQLLARYFPANIPAYQDFTSSAGASQGDAAYAPLGVRLGKFLISPSLDVAIGYDTSPFQTGTGSGSVATQTNASIGTASDWSTNELTTSITVSNTDYLNLGKSVTDWTAAVGTTIQQANNQINLGFAYINAVLLPTDLGSFGQKTAINDQDEDLRASYTIGTGRFTLVPALIGDIFSFNIPGGSSQLSSQGDLFDRDALTATLTGNYEFAGGHNLVTVLSDTVVSYGKESSVQHPANFTDASLLVGIEYRSSAIFSYRALVGYEEHIPTGEGTFNTTLAAPAAEVDVIWTPSVLTTLTGKISQSFQSTPTDTAQGLSETSVLLALAHSISRSAELKASAQLIRATFPNSGTTTGGTELSVQSTLEADVHLSRHVVVSARYSFTEESGTNASSLSFRRHEVFLQGRLQW